jgi:hypothetical protein
MKLGYKKGFLAFAALIVMSVTTESCRRQLDINTNPNSATQVTPELLLPTAEVEIATALGVDVHTNGNFWAQYWTQNPSSSQYKDIEQYQPSGSDYDREWSQFYSALEDLKKMGEAATTAQKPQYVAISKLLTAYTFQIVTDAWGDVPYREALAGELQSGQILSPHFDPQALIYDSLISTVNQGLALINTSPTAPGRPGTDDLIFGGNMTNWRKFGNTLKLKLYMRLSEVEPAKAQAGIAALVNGTTPFLDSNLNAQVNFVSTSGNRNPLSTEIQALGFTPNQVASRTSIDSLQANDDPRLAVFYEPAFDGICNEKGFIGLRQGNYNAPAGTLVSLPGPTTGGNSDVSCTVSAVAARRAPVRLLMGYESLFLQAEAVARGWASPGRTAESLFNSAVRGNFVHLGLTAADANTYLASSYWGRYPTAGGVQQQVRHIITQKWFSMTGIQGFEAWTEWRRTGYPDFFEISVTSLIGNRYPVRFLYPSTELTRNSNFPGQKQVYDRVYWDVR